MDGHGPGRGNNGLGESFTLSLEQVVTRLGALELRFHDTQRLPCREDGLAILIPPPIVSQRHGLYPVVVDCGGPAARMGGCHTAAPDMFAIRQWPRYTRGGVGD